MEADGIQSAAVDDAVDWFVQNVPLENFDEADITGLVRVRRQHG